MSICDSVDHYHNVIKPRLHPHLNLRPANSQLDEIDNHSFCDKIIETETRVETYTSAHEASTVISSRWREQPPGREDSVRQPFSSRLWAYPDGRALDPCPTPFYTTRAVRRFSTPSPLPPGITLGSTSDRPPRGGGNAAAHIAGQEFAIRACTARLRLRSRLSRNGLVPS